MDKLAAREIIMEATIQEFNDNGRKFTMDNVARRTGMSKKTLYCMFNDKRDLFIKTVDYVFDQIKVSEKLILEDPEMDIIDKIRRVMIVLPDRYVNIDFRKIFLLKEKYPEVCDRIQRKLETEWEPTLELLDEAMRQGRVKKVPIPVIKSMVEGTIEQFLHSTVLVENSIEYEKALEHMINIIIDGIRMN